MSDPTAQLVDALRRLPGLGRRSAERIAVRLLRDRSRRLLHELLEALRRADDEARLCRTCGAITTREADPCRLCTDPRRDDAVLCVVAQPGDIAMIESSGAYRGRYHALMGRISPMDGEGPGALRVQALFERIAGGPIREVLLALDTDMESDATVNYLSEKLVKRGVRVSRIAHGLPAGSGIAYSDPVTLSRAIEGRRIMG